MTIFNWIIVALWLALVLVWAVSALSAKRDIGGNRALWRAVAIRLALGVVALVALRMLMFGPARPAIRSLMVEHNPVAGLVGVLLCGLGVAIAIAARLTLGRNWGMPMSQKEDPELVTTGPYAVVRHPIYAGLLLAVIGSVIGLSVLWLVPLIGMGSYFVHAARREEALMLARFPEQYPAYLSRTYMLVPFLI
jgi:protein-S-isoprenylcysteine O-methyltransferase Ste14